MKKQNIVGIDDMAFYVPSLYLPIEILADKRDLEYVKLNKGLGLTHMAIPDAHEDAATMAANAAAEIIEKNGLNPRDIGRIYLGTESALDGAKPTATYVLTMLRDKYRDTYGGDCFRNCDVVDLTFACVGGVDALHNTLDWVRGDETRMGIVITSDNAKYELASTGEYTQGAGAVAMLIKHNPRLLAIHDIVGVGTKGVHDFYKPKRTATKAQVIAEALELAGVKDADIQSVLNNLPKELEVKGVLDINEEILTLHKDTPVFDGQYSNQCYQDRIREAYSHFRSLAEEKGHFSEDENLLTRWSRLIFHLPYAFHAKRIFSEIFMKELQNAGDWHSYMQENDLTMPHRVDEDDAAFEKLYTGFLRSITKTKGYREFVQQRMERAQRASSLIGNMYACSIFMGLMSTLESDWKEGEDLNDAKFGFFGYGSGSKSKCFEGDLQPQWKEVVSNFNVFNRLEKRTAIDYATYENLHCGRQQESIVTPKDEFLIERIGTEGVREGARYYKFAASISVSA
jgi:hydroxymethylglutaryl-CoA synthase